MSTNVSKRRRTCKNFPLKTVSATSGDVQNDQCRLGIAVKKLKFFAPVLGRSDQI